MNPDEIINCCEANWDAYKSDCSGFVKAVSNDLHVAIVNGNADAITQHIATLPTQTQDGTVAKQWADQGKFVVGGLKGSDHNPPRAHGHVVVVVAGGLAHGKYPTAYWGSLNGVGKKNETINWAWTKEDRDNVIYSVLT